MPTCPSRITRATLASALAVALFVAPEAARAATASMLIRKPCSAMSSRTAWWTRLRR